MQAAYLSAFRFLGDFAGEAAFSTWLTRIAVNEALARRRRGRWLTPVVDVAGAGPDPVATPEEQAASREAVRLLERALDQLPAAQRVVFLLREVEQVSTEDAARALGISPDAVKVRLHRARRGLRAALLAGLGPGAELGTGAREAFPFFAPRCDRVAAAVMARILGPDGAAPQSA